MNKEYQVLYQKEIADILKIGLIKEPSSPHNYYGFYVNKHSEQIIGIPRLVINYKPLNTFLVDDTYLIPHKSSLISKIAGAKSSQSLT